LTFTADVSDAKALDHALGTIKREVGPINVVVANAGYLPAPAPVSEADPDDWFKGFEVNVKGTFNLFRAFMNNKSDKQPTFISLNTGAAHAGVFPGLSSYGTSKLASAQLVSYLAAENPEIRAVSFHPGVLATEMYDVCSKSNRKRRFANTVTDLGLRNRVCLCQETTVSICYEGWCRSDTC
jgi:NAD(P)-dependent dehydrogenase (short-subunit alcohol dehydrogenase family)